MNRYYIKEKSFVCDPNNFAVKMDFESNKSIVNILFFDGKIECFNFRYQMSMTSNEDEFNEMLSYIMESLIDSLTKREFQEMILDGELLGLNFYNLVKSVRSKSGTLIWKRS